MKYPYPYPRGGLFNVHECQNCDIRIHICICGSPKYAISFVAWCHLSNLLSIERAHCQVKKGTEAMVVILAIFNRVSETRSVFDLDHAMAWERRDRNSSPRYYIATSCDSLCEIYEVFKITYFLANTMYISRGGLTFSREGPIANARAFLCGAQ